MQRVLLDINADANYQELRRLRKLLEQTLGRLNLAKELVNKQLTVFAECATNFVEHSQGIQKIGLHLAMIKSTITLECIGISSKNEQASLDSWLGQTNRQTADSILDQLDPLRSGGRGAALVHSYADNVHIVKSYIDDSLITDKDDQPQPYSNPLILWRNAIKCIWPLQTNNPQPRILVVEDDPAQNTLYCLYLSANYAVTGVESINSAIQQLAANRFDLILSDIHFPQYDGIYLKQQLHDTPTPFIFMSADNDQATQNTIRGLGIDDFISKPFAKQQLLESVERVLIRAKQLSSSLEKEWNDAISQALAPELPKYSTSWKTVLRSEGPHQGGGDLVLSEQLADETFIIVADLMGHNIASKFFAHAYMGYMRGLLAAFKAQPSVAHLNNNSHTKTSQLPAPDVFLNALSQALYADALLSSTMCTCCAIRLGKDRQIDIASAGHPLPWLIAENAINTLPLKGMLPGLVKDLVYDCYSFTLKDGERLAIYTDGLTEAINRSDKRANDARISAVEQALACSNNQAIGQALTNVFDSLFSEASTARYTDDTLLMLIEASA